MRKEKRIELELQVISALLYNKNQKIVDYILSLPEIYFEYLPFKEFKEIRQEEKEIDDKKLIGVLISNGIEEEAAKKLVDKFKKLGKKEYSTVAISQLEKEHTRKLIIEVLRQTERELKVVKFHKIKDEIYKMINTLSDMKVIDIDDEPEDRDIVSDIIGLKEYLTGFSPLDDYARILSGETYVIGGDTGHGKTTFILNILINKLERKADGWFYFFPYENFPAEVLVKLYKMYKKDRKPISEILTEVRNNNMYSITALRDFAKLLEENKIHIVSNNYPLEDIAFFLEKETNIKGRKIEAIGLDYIGRIPIRRKAEGEVAYSYRSSELKTIAKTMQIPVFITSQVSFVEGRFIYRYSRTIKEDSSIALLLEKSKFKNGRPSLKILIDKNRHGIEGLGLAFEWDTLSGKIKNEGFRMF